MNYYIVRSYGYVIVIIKFATRRPSKALFFNRKSLEFSHIDKFSHLRKRTETCTSNVNKVED